jgi:hypothetical protein
MNREFENYEFDVLRNEIVNETMVLHGVEKGKLSWFPTNERFLAEKFGQI